MKQKVKKKLICFIMVAMLCITQMCSAVVQAVDISGLASESRLPIVLTLGADLSEEQKTQIVQYFGIEISEVTVITITNQDERDKLGGLISEEKIGTRTFSCALVNPTNAGGIQVKTANMNYVTSNMIAGQLSTSGVYNCEVLTAAPFEVSGTGALTGVMMAYEEASGTALDEGKKQLANVELVTTTNIAESVGQDQATLIVNDIKIHIVRDQISDEQEVYAVVDEVIAITETAAAEAAQKQGKEAPSKLGEVEHSQLYDFSYQFSQMDYDYAQMRPTLERVTYNVATSSGIDDPLTDTFTTINEEQVLPSNSILLGTDDEIWGDDAIINATSHDAVSERPAEPIDVFAGEVSLTSAGGVRADNFIEGTNIIAFKDVNGSYALMDLNGNLLTDPVYDGYFNCRYGYIKATLNDGSGMAGVLAPDGTVEVDFKYHVVDVVGNMWALGFGLKGGGTEDEHDFTDYENYYLIDYVDVYYVGPQGSQCVGQLTRDGYYEVNAKGDFINIRARSGVITTYDSTFAAVQTTDNLYNFGDYDYDEGIETALEAKTGYYVGSFYGKYATISDSNAYGIVDKYGNIIVPMQFSSFDTSSANSLYESGGYFVSIDSAKTTFVTAGGNVSASYDYGYDQSATSYGMTVRVKKEDGGYILLSADGVTTDLGTSYSYIYALSGAKGMLWYGDNPNGGYDLIDWHGNVLISGSDGYSVSSNGNYLIAREGYTSSTLYMVNDAEPVDLANSVGGAQEMEVEVKEASSLEVYQGDPQIQKVGTLLSEEFISGTDLLVATNDGSKYAIMDVTDTQLTPAQYEGYVECSEGLLIVTDADTGKKGVLSQEAQQIIPCEYEHINVLDEKWVVAFKLKEATESDYDFEDYYNEIYYQIDTAKIHYINGTEISSVEVGRDQYLDADAEGEYLNIEDRSTGAVTTYDSSFNAIASASYVNSFGDFSYETVAYKTLEDKCGYDVWGIYDDGYATVYQYDSSSGNSMYGVVDMNGEVIIPVEYESVNYSWETNTINTNGYFSVRKNGMCGYVTKGGEVSCEFKYEKDNFQNYGMSGVYKNGDGTYKIIAADGTESGPYPNSPSNCTNGLLYKVRTIEGKLKLVDWHGNEVLSGYEYYYFAASGKYFVASNYNEPTELYTIDGAEVVGVSGNVKTVETDTAAEAEETVTETPEAEVPEEEPVAETPEAEAPEAEVEAPETEAPVVEEAPEAEVPETTAPAEDGSDNSGEEIKMLLQSASVLIDVDLATNKNAVIELLKQAKDRAETGAPSIVAVVDSAIMLLDMENADANSIKALLTSAMSLI